MTKPLKEQVSPAAEASSVLLSAFEPFGGAKHNPSQDAVEELARRADRDELTAQAEHCGVVVIPVLLPVEFSTAAQMLSALTDRHSPDLVISLGLAAGAETIRLERVGLNLRDARIPDNAGAQPADEPIIAHGEAALFSTLRVKAARERITAAGIPVALSLSAGSYVCNDVLYTVLHHLHTQNLTSGAGFAHLPDLHASDCPVSLDQAATAVDLLITESLRPLPDAAAPGGALY